MLEQLKEKLLMLKMKKIIVEELNSDYYENAANIMERDFLIDEKVELDGEIIKHELSIVKYFNGYYNFEERYYQIKSLPVYGVNITEYNKDIVQEKIRKIS